MDATETRPDNTSPTPTSDDTMTKVRIHPLHMLSNVPYDIFLIIAVSCWKGGDGHDHLDFPITASHVCRTWRRYALETGVFWSTLEFRREIPDRVIMKYKMWLERAQSAPLDLFIGPQPFKGASVNHTKSIMRLIPPHVSQ